MLPAGLLSTLMAVTMLVVIGSLPEGLYTSRPIFKPIQLWEACSDKWNELNSSKP
jgi:hypothetical protein